MQYEAYRLKGNYIQPKLRKHYIEYQIRKHSGLALLELERHRASSCLGGPLERIGVGVKIKDFQSPKELLKCASRKQKYLGAQLVAGKRLLLVPW